MKQAIRLSILSIVILTFLTVAPIVVMQAYGYCFDWSSWSNISIKKTGDIYLKTNVKKAIIYLNNKILKEQTPRLIHKLKPNIYKVKIIKPGFHPWQKNIKVQSGLVNKNYILLLPQNPKIKPMGKAMHIENNFIDKKLIVKNNEIFINVNDKDKLKLITRYQDKIKKAVWYKDLNHIIFQVQNNIKFIETDGMNTIDFVSAQDFAYDNNENILFIKQDNAWKQIDLNF